MRKKRQALVLLLLATLTLNACQLQVATDSAAAFTQAAGQTGEDARSILQKAAEVMAFHDSYVYSAESLITLDGKTDRTQTRAILFPRRGDGLTVITQNGQVTTTYLKNHRMYLSDPQTGRWVYVDLMAEDPPAVRIHERVNGYMDVARTSNGLSLTSKHPLSAFEFYSLTGIETQEKAALDAMARMGQTMTTMVTFELDEAHRYQRVIYEQVTVTGGVSARTVTTTVYSSYDAAQPVRVPQAVLDEAVLLEADPTTK